MAVDRKTIVVVPLGSTEQHSLHLPVDTDTKLVTAVCEEAEKRCPEKVLLTPTVWTGHSPHHLDFGGTVSLNYEVYSQMLYEIADSFRKMGFRKLFFVNGHGGNGMPVSITQQEMKLADPEFMLCTANYWELGREKILENREGGKHAMGHACELETSLYLYIDGGAVRKEQIRDAGRTDDSGFLGIGMFNGGPVSYLSNFAEFTDTGGFGTPSLATAEKGKIYFDAVADGMEKFLTVFYEKNKFFEAGGC